MSEVEYPDMRLNVVSSVADLADAEYQQRVWVAGQPRPGEFPADFTFHINILDDVRVLDHPEEAVGGILRNRAEALAMRRLGLAIDDLFVRYGTELTDREYLALPEWAEILAAAHSAQRLLAAPH